VRHAPQTLGVLLIRKTLEKPLLQLYENFWDLVVGSLNFFSRSPLQTFSLRLEFVSHCGF
jgi:hypothetical protein